MRHIIFIATLAAILCLTGCPKQQGPSDGGDGKLGDEKTVSPTPGPVANSTKKVLPATEEAKATVELVTGLSGKYELTPTGTVRAITLNSSELTEDTFKLIGKQPDLQNLEIYNFRELNDASVEHLTNLKNLKTLALTNSGITNAGVKKIVSAFPNLTSLNLSSNTLLSDEAMKEIIKLQDLEQLIVNYCDFSEFGVMGLTKLPKLQELDIRANMRVGNVGMSFVAKIPQLKKLSHRSPAVDDSGIESLTAAKGLTTLMLQDCNNTDEAGALLRQFESMTYLNLFRCGEFGSTGLLDLKGMKLERLDLRGLPSVNDTGMEIFRDMTTLKRLCLTELESVTDTGFINLVPLKDLELLLVSDIEITDTAVETIAKLPNLKDLTIISTKITDASIEKFLAMPKLQRLTLTDNAAVTDAGKEKLKESKKFQTLNLGK